MNVKTNQNYRLRPFKDTWKTKKACSVCSKPAPQLFALPVLFLYSRFELLNLQPVYSFIIMKKYRHSFLIILNCNTMSSYDLVILCLGNHSAQTTIYIFSFCFQIHFSSPLVMFYFTFLSVKVTPFHLLQKYP